MNLNRGIEGSYSRTWLYSLLDRLFRSDEGRIRAPMSALADCASADASAAGDEGEAAVVILGFAYRHSELMELRIETGISEMRRLEASYCRVMLVLTGGVGVGSKDTCTEAAFMEECCVERGVDRKLILREEVRDRA